MEAKNEKILNITLKDKEIELLKSVIKKCVSEDKKIGFNQKVFNDDEMKFIKDILTPLIFDNQLIK